MKLFMGALIAVSMASFAAASASNSTVTSLGTDRFSVGAGATQNVIAGSIYHLDLSASSSTNYWAGVWGNVSGSVQLRNGAGRELFSLNVGAGTPKSAVGSNINSYVLAYNNNAIPNFGGMSIQSGANIDTKTGVVTTLTDSATNLFTFNSGTIIVGNSTFGNVNSAQFCPVSYNGSSGVKLNNDCLFGESMLGDGTNNLMFAMPAQAITWTGDASKKLFDNATFANYEGILYSNNSGTSAATTYNFYLELR